MAHKHLAVILGAAMAIAACSKQAPVADAVARVNGEAITKQQFDDLVARNMRRYSGQAQALPAGIRSRIEEGVLRRMIDDAIILQRAQKEGVAISDAELDAHFEQHKQRFRSPQAFEDYLARSDNTEAALRDDLRKSLLRDRLVERLTGPVDVDDAAIAQYYQDNTGHFTEAAQMQVRRLVLRMPPELSDAQRQRVRHLARRLHTEAKQHPERFGTICREHSQGPEAEHEGSMGTVMAGRMPELDKLVGEGLGVNAIGPIVETAQGLEMYQLTSLRAQHTRPLAEVQSAIRDALVMRRRNDRRQELLRQLKEAAKIETLITFTAPAAAPAGAPAALPAAAGTAAPAAPAAPGSAPAAPPRP